MKRILTNLLCSAFALATASSYTMAQANLSYGNNIDIRQLLSRIPKVVHKGSWPLDFGYVRYDSLHRSGELLIGKYADNLQAACSASGGFSSMPDESNWEQPIKGYNCVDGNLVLYAQLKAMEPKDAKSDVRLEAGVGGACPGFRRNVDARNTNKNRAIRATIGYHNANGYEQSLPVTLGPGELRRSLLYCDFGDAWVTGAFYTN